MTDTTPAPAEKAAQQASTTALDAEQVAPTWFIPQATQDNYSQIARDQAAVRGVEPKQVMRELAEQWDKLHEAQPLDGYDHLAAWGKEFDPAVGGAPTGLAVLQARALESARRDPYQAVVGDQALVEQGVAAQKAQDAAAAGVLAAPSVDPSSGALPNSGPIGIPGDVTTGTDEDQRQQRAAAAQQDDDDSAPSPSEAPSVPDSSSESSTVTTPAPAEPSTGPSGRRGTSSSSSSS